MMKNSAFAKGLIVARLVILAAITAPLLFSCVPKQSQTLLSATTTEKENVIKVLGSVPFAYDLAVDTISYNSCIGSGLNGSGKLHGLKLGANEGFVDSNGSGAVKGGIKLKSDFLLYLAKNVDPTFPNTAITSSQIQFILQNSDANKNLQIQFAVRAAANLNVVPDVVFINSGSPPTITLNRDGIYSGGTLSLDPILTAITKNVQFGAGGTVLSEGPRIYNISEKSSPEPIQASFGYSNAFDASFPPIVNTDDGFGAGEEYSDLVRSRLNSLLYILAITYGNQTTISSFDQTPSQGLNSPKRKTETDLKKAFGRSFELGFSSKSLTNIPSWKKNLLTKITEKTLEDGRLAAGVSWTCENVLIMKTNQLNNKKITEPSCSELIASDLISDASGSSVAPKVKNIRRHYSEDLWAIGFFYPANTIYNPATRKTNPTLCLVNKQADCYLPTVGLIASAPAEDIGIQYNSSQECYLSRFSQMGVSYIGNKTGDVARRLGRCAQYASVCIRASTSF